MLDRLADSRLDFPEHAVDTMKDMTHDPKNVEVRFYMLFCTVLLLFYCCIYAVCTVLCCLMVF